MPLSSSPPKRDMSADVDRLIAEVAWAKTCLIVSAASAPASPQRTHELEKLRQAIAPARRRGDAILARGQGVPENVLVALRVCELALPELEAGAGLRRNGAA